MLRYLYKLYINYYYCFIFKALSRKSFVLSETGNNKDAQEVIKKALEIEPDNIDLINLDKEIKVIEKEMREEQMVMNTTKGFV